MVCILPSWWISSYQGLQNHKILKYLTIGSELAGQTRMHHELLDALPLFREVSPKIRTFSYRARTLLSEFRKLTVILSYYAMSSLPVNLPNWLQNFVFSLSTPTVPHPETVINPGSHTSFICYDALNFFLPLRYCHFERSRLCCTVFCCCCC